MTRGGTVSADAELTNCRCFADRGVVRLWLRGLPGFALPPHEAQSTSPRSALCLAADTVLSDRLRQLSQKARERQLFEPVLLFIASLSRKAGGQWPLARRFEPGSVVLGIRQAEWHATVRRPG